MIFITGAVKGGKFQTIKCDHIHTGYYVAIYFGHPGILNVCEFEVYGGRFPLGLFSNNILIFKFKVVLNNHVLGNRNIVNVNIFCNNLVSLMILTTGTVNFFPF